MPSLWKLGGLTPLKLLQLVNEKIRTDELSTRAASLSYYFILALFPMLLFVVSLVGAFAGPGSELHNSMVSALGRLAPGSTSGLIQKVINETFTHSGGIKLAVGILGSLWAASGGMDAVVVSLNVIHRVSETRPWWKKRLTIVALTIGLASLIIIALILVLYGGRLGQFTASEVGLGNAFALVWKVLQWPVAFAAMFLSYSLIYYFAPNLEEREWHWVTPGAATGVLLWLVASFGFKMYLHFFNNYSATYGSLGAAIILMLWLYITGFAVLIGGEVNWVIDNEDRQAAALALKKRLIQQQITAA